MPLSTGTIVNITRVHEVAWISMSLLAKVIIDS